VKFIAFSIAKFVFLETIRKEQKQKAAADGFYQNRGAHRSFGDSDGFEPLRDCFEKLYDRERALLLEYFADLPSAQLAAHRQRLADREQMDLNALRNRISRLRRRLEECVGDKK
jgi:DNA-directed RNA polymerase specialized sigma24 family protein